MDEGRWITVTPSQFQHEREALEYVRKALPNAEPYRVWSNFTFTADTGHVREVDLLVAAPSGLYLIEVKSLHGRLTSSGSNWVLSGSPTSAGRIFDNPLHLANSKAQQLKSMLQRAAQRHHLRVPFIQAAVFLSVPGLKVELPDHHLHHVYGASGQSVLPEIWEDLLRRPPADDRQRLTPEFSRRLGDMLKQVGIAKSRRHLQVGSWKLTPPPFDNGPTWQDYLAEHSQVPAEKRRIRLYLVERGADQETRASISRAARREMLALHGISHPGIVQVDTMEEHQAGPALIFRHDPRAQRLDHYMARYGSRLGLDERLGMIRQLAETISYAHGRRLHHRALSARSVYVTPTRGPGMAEEAGWLRPHLQVSEWQIATRTSDGSGSGQSEKVIASTTSHAGQHLEAAAQAYLAPELSAPSPDPVAMDVFGLGSLSFLLLTGTAPAQTRAELLARLTEDWHLTPSAVADSITESMDKLVQAATAPVPGDRLTTVADFLEMLEAVEDDLTAPDAASDHPAEEDEAPEDEPDPLLAKPGEVIAGQWRVEKRLGTGSTSRAFKVTNLETGQPEVLKVALTEEKAAQLEHEAAVLRRLEGDSRVIRLLRPEPLRSGQRTFIVIDYVGDHTVARKIREDGRLTADELERYSEYLLGAADHLEGQGISHRDIKPDNVAIKVRPNRTRQLVLFDFSLAGISVREIEAGTPHYLDPFLGSANRQTYDAHAERYALAVTLYEMSSGELPTWGDGRTEPRFTEGPPGLAVEAFEPAIRDGLVDFFHRALNRNAKERFDSLREMTAAWRLVFQRSDESLPVGSEHPTGTGELPAEDDTPQQTRDKAAADATRATVVDAAGLTPRAISAAGRLGATTVGDLLDLPSKDLFNLPGLGAKTRRELQDRIRSWRARLGEDETSPLVRAEKKAAKQVVEEAASEGDGHAFQRIGLDTVAALLVPGPSPGRRNASEVEATRLLLGLPAESGEPSPLPAWSKQELVARRLDPQVSAGRIAQILGAQRRRWRSEPLVRSVLAELIALLDEMGRVAEATELADALLSHRGSSRTGLGLRRAIAMAAVRAAVEIDPVEGEPRLLIRRHGDRILVALEVTEDDAPDTPAGPALLDYADALGREADRLAEPDVLPTPGTVLRRLRGIRVTGVDTALEDRRLVALAAAASPGAAATARLEIYPRDLDPVRALRLTQAGVVPAGERGGEPVGLTVDNVHDRVRGRFPALAPLPGRTALDRLLREAGFDLVWKGGRYLSRVVAESTAGAVPPRRPAGQRTSRFTADAPDRAEAMRSEERLLAILERSREGGFRALTVEVGQYEEALAKLTWLGAAPVNVAALFLDGLREQVVPGRKPTWATILDHDLPEPHPRFLDHTERAWSVVGPRLARMREAADGPVLLHDAGPFTRYRAGDLLPRLAEQARHGGSPLWLLCPMPDPTRPPRLDGALVPAQLPNEWIQLPKAWIELPWQSEAAT